MQHTAPMSGGRGPNRPDSPDPRVQSIRLGTVRHIASPAIGLGLHLWQRHRLGISAVTAYLVFLILLAHAPGLHLKPPTIYMSCMPFGFGILYLMAIVTHSEADVAAEQSGYPSYLLTLPLSTCSLVVWPMFYGVVAVTLAWIALTDLVIRPHGAPVDSAWPAAMLAAITSSLQAIFWSPVRVRYFRLALVLTIVPALIAIAVFAVHAGMTSAALTALFAGCILPAFAIAWQGVTRARNGDGPRRANCSEPTSRQANGPTIRLGGDYGAVEHPEWSRPHPLTPEAPPPFRGPRHAQRWLEWKQSGLILPLFVGIMLLVMSLPLAFIHEYAPLMDAANPSWHSTIEINLYIKAYLMNPWLLPPFIATVIGYGAGKSEDRRKDGALPAFFATRPLSDLDLVLAKFQVAVFSALAAWAILLAFVLFWTLLPARDGSSYSPFLAVLMKHQTTQSVIAEILTLVWLIAWTWRGQIVSLFAALSDRKWFALGYPAVLHGGLLLALVVGVTWSLDPTHAPPLHILELLLVRCMAVAIAAKAVLTVCAFYALHRYGLAGTQTLAKTAAVWLLMVTALCASVRWFLHIEPLALESLPSALHSDWCVMAISILCVPIARLSLAPLALFLRRHR